ncbi:hypothetical protein NQ314_003255 [Rhamnusium bicolor]|uniref:J domain-containing protein n=1 Tax=Rhamnusium bicolor TaxID=1586634 RepID=A0AAV8ZMF9_9CUCU|nr:hypothetical protein NQ314_003255 [Rhamnusium bicolor]
MPLTLYKKLYHQCNVNVNRFISTGKILNNHYEVLNLSRTCTSKDIKDSFIKLSKENHPDVSKSKDSHQKFLQINEAYKVLSKTESRRLYDLGLTTSTIYPQNSNVEVRYRRQYYGSDPWKDPSFYRNRNKSEDRYNEGKPYYGIKGVKKVSNFTVVIVCLSITVFVVVLQLLAIRNSFTFRRDQLIRRSNEAQDSLSEVRQAASLNGNELQIELLKLRFKNSAKHKSEP